MPVVYMAFKKDIVNPEFPEKAEASRPMLIPLVITAVIAVVLGVCPNFGLHLYDLACMAGNAIFGIGGTLL